MEAFLVLEHGGQTPEVKVGVFDFPGVTMGGVCDFFKGECAFSAALAQTMSSMSMVLMTASLTLEYGIPS